MRLLLNATRAEVGRLGGDLTYYRDLEQLSGGGLEIMMLPDSAGRRARAVWRRAAGRALRASLPTRLRRAALVASRTLPIGPAAAREADVVLSHIWFPNQRPALSKPVIWSSQGIAPSAYYEKVGGGFDLRDVIHLYGLFGRAAAALLVWTEDGARRLAEACPFLAGKVQVIHAPVLDAPDALPVKPSLTDGVTRFLFVGGDAERKGLREAVQAFAQAAPRDGRVRLTVVSRPQHDVARVLRSLPGTRLIPPGPAVDVLRLMTESDVLLLPTHADTYALTAVEAMARGCAVLISDLPPLPEVVPDGVAGFTVPSGDADRLGAAIRTTISEGPLLRRMQESAHRLYLDRHAPDVFRARLRRLAEGVLAGRLGPNRLAEPGAGTDR